MNSQDEYGYDQARLIRGKALITALDDANRAQEATKCDAQQTTRDQDKAVKELCKLYAQCITIAQLSLGDKKQLLKRLGIPARTSKTTAQRAIAHKPTKSVPPIQTPAQLQENKCTPINTSTFPHRKGIPAGGFLFEFNYMCCIMSLGYIS